MTTVIPIKPAAEIEITPDNKCSFCRGSNCCTYLTQQIDAPRSMADFDTLLWQVSHLNTQIYKDEDGWFLLVNNRCTHLLPDNRCAVYHDRPQICREHSTTDCEFEGPAGAGDFQLYFPDYPSLLTYCRRRYKHWDRRFVAGKK